MDTIEDELLPDYEDYIVEHEGHKEEDHKTKQYRLLSDEELNESKEIDLDLIYLQHLLNIRPNQIILYADFIIKFHTVASDLDPRNIEDIRSKISSETCKDIDLQTIDDIIKTCRYLITIEKDDIICAIIAANFNGYYRWGFYDSLHIELICSSRKNNEERFKLSFGYYLMFCLLNYVRERYGALYVTLKSVSSAVEYYKKLGYSFGKSCKSYDDKDDYVYVKGENSYNMKFCNINSLMSSIYEKLFTQLQNDWINYRNSLTLL